jgi:hypothetical protein
VTTAEKWRQIRWTCAFADGIYRGGLVFGQVAGEVLEGLVHVSKDGIFLIHDDGGLVEMQPEPYASEELLQRLLADYPSVMAGSQINPAAPRRWLLVAREAGVPSSEGGGNQWSVDHLFLDQDAIPTIVEVKRSSDTRIRREVVGQMLDYAANGVRYWPIEDLRARFERTCRELGRSPEKEVAELRAGDVDGFWQQVEANLLAGRVRLLFVADRIPKELQRIVEFLNEQMRPAEVLAIELQHYRGEGVRTLVPRLIGATSAAQQTKGPRDPRPLEDVLAAASPEVRQLDELLRVWALSQQLETTQTPRAKQVKGHNGETVVQFYVENGELEFNLAALTSRGLTDVVEQVGLVLDDISGRQLTRKSPFVKPAPLVAQWQRVSDEVLGPYLTAIGHD